MTRINGNFPVEKLCDEHLKAECREIGRPVNKVLKRLSKRHPMHDIPKSFRLGTGHETFFFNKIQFLHKRQLLLLEELHKRNLFKDFKIDDRYQKIKENHPIYYKDWKGSKESLDIISNRIKERIPKNPHFYREKISEDRFLSLIQEAYTQLDFIE
jgi:deoxyribonuclease (pyrimidine dimer)